MKRLGRYLKNGLLGLAVLLVILTVGIAILSQTHGARQYLRQRAVTYLNQSYRGHFSIGGLDGSMLWGIRLHNLEVSDRGVQILSVATVSVGYSIVDLLRKQEFSSIEIDRAVGHLARQPDQQWNLLDALSARQPQPKAKPPSEAQLTIRDLVLKDSTIEVFQAGKTYRIDPIFIGLYFNLDRSGIDAQVRRVALRLVAPGLPNLAADGALAYHSGGAPPALSIPTLALSTAASRVRIVGTIDNLDTLNSNTTVSLDYLGAGDIQRYISKWAPRQNLSGTIRVYGPKKDLHGSADLFVAGGKINARGDADLAEKTPSFRGGLDIAGFNIGKAIQGAALQGVVDANIKAQGVGTALGAMTVDGALRIHDARASALQTRLITIQAGLRHNVATVAGELTGGVGRAEWHGQVDFGPARAYELALSLDHFNVRRVSAAKQRIDSNLNLRARIVGRGFGLADASARADVALLPSTVGQVRIARGRIGAMIADRRVRTNLTLSGTAAQLKADGDIALTADRHARLAYDLQLADLGPWLALTGQQGGGSLNLAGRVAGTLESLRTQDQVRFTALRYGTNYVGCGSASADMNAIGKPGMYGHVALSMSQIRGGVKLKLVHLTASVRQLHPVTVVGISLLTEDERSLKNRIEAEIRKGPATSELTLARVSIQDPEETWTNPFPARIVADQNGITINRFLLTSQQSRIFLDGSASKAGTQNVLLQIDGLRLSAVKAAFQNSLDLSGVLSIQARVGGTAAAPVIHFVSNVSGLRVTGQSYQGLSAAVAYENERANLDLAFRQDPIHSLTAKGLVPIAVGWTQGFQMKPRGDIDFHATSSGLSLAVLNALAPNTVREADGLLLLNLTVGGRLTQPVATGFVKIQRAAGMIIPTGVKIEDLELGTEFSSQSLRIDQMHMSSGAGTIDAHGQLTMENYKPGNIEMAIHMVNWPAIRNQQYRATANGQIKVGGTAVAPVITGNVEILDALLRPDLAFLTSGPPPPDTTIHLVSTTVPASPPNLIPINPSCPPSPKIVVLPSTKLKPVGKSVNNQPELSVDMMVHLRRDIWVKQENGSAELTGDVHVVKAASEPLRLIGEVETVRGWLNVMDKQFKVTKAKIAFTGGVPIDPGLDITADYQAQQYLVHVIVGGTANKPTLTFKSEPDLEQADILSVLLFGKPTSQLSGGERTDLKTRASEVATGFAASQVSHQVSQALGLEEMDIELRQTGRGVGIGSYLGQNTYATFSQDFSQQGGQRVDLEHYLTRHIEVDTDTTARGDRGADVFWSTNY
jgi:autotransporter translocation and assembly factor TamB